MPLPMIHLAVAVDMFDGGKNPAPFLLGSISPDAIHMRKGTARGDKKRTHLNVDARYEDFDTLKATYLRYLNGGPGGGVKGEAEGQGDSTRDSSEQVLDDWRWFVRGYFAHLMTDYYWHGSVYASFKDRAIGDGLEQKERDRAYYRDTDQIDFNLYREKSWKDDVWAGLVQARQVAFEPYLTADEIHFWRYRVVHWFDLLSKEPGIEPVYITERVAEAFVADSAAKVKALQAEWEQEG
ncbi:MAG: hypothetical protein K0R75_3259 [Paenibacillaceae bacterium]|jgi:hypothetical protein|nr:hypothetical protein [Paenibacillaceae bacterium]